MRWSSRTHYVSWVVICPLILVDYSARWQCHHAFSRKTTSEVLMYQLLHQWTFISVWLDNYSSSIGLDVLRSFFRWWSKVHDPALTFSFPRIWSSFRNGCFKCTLYLMDIHGQENQMCKESENPEIIPFPGLLHITVISPNNRLGLVGR